MDTSAFTRQFVEEARDRLKALNAATVRLEAEPGAATVLADILREAHSLKGSAQMLGLADVSEVAHQLEDLILPAKREGTGLDVRAFDLVFRTIDVLGSQVEALARQTALPAEPVPVAATVSATPRGAPSGQSTGSAANQSASQSTGQSTSQSIRVSVDKLEGLTHMAPDLVIQSLKAAERHAELRRIEAALGRLRDRIREARLGPSTKSRTAELGDYADAVDGLNRRMRALVTNLSDDQVRLSLITEHLRQQVIELTMLPVATVFDTFPRAVRDLARSTGKDVALTMVGKDTEIDKRIIEQIADPLVHLVRNAIDHGLEPAADRARAGKAETGNLRVSAEQRGNRVHIIVQDDGRGIDPNAIRTAAVRKGLAKAQEIDEWSHERLFGLIFEPGFSTRTKVTDVSGRGVGMDVVRVVVDSLGGHVRVHSEVGKGTSVVLDLPLSVALLRVVLIDMHGEAIGIPTASIRQILRLRAETVLQLESGACVELDGKRIPLAGLASLFGLPSDHTGDERTVLVIETREGRVAVSVDAVREEQELVFQELSGPLRGQTGMSGAALLGSGEIVPILDPQAIIPLVHRAAAGEIARVPISTTMTRRPGRVLVVEDSLVAGELQKGILVGAGYEAGVAHDGVEALDELRRREWDLVISDVDMPNMDGLELTSHLRADPRLHTIPVIIVTSRDSAEHRRQGLDAGADVYLTKHDFDQDQMLAAVRRLLAQGRPHDPLTESARHA
jgi:two-component system chemotaxis sensor kinase CheA